MGTLASLKYNAKKDMDAVGTQPLPVEVHGATLNLHVGFTFNQLMVAFGVY